MRKLTAIISAVLLIALARLLAFLPPDDFRFVILGDRTGETRPGVYEEVWREIAAENPAFVVSVGDSIQGLNDDLAEPQWQAWQRILTPYHRFPLYLAPGNHDIWSTASEKLFVQYSRHPAHYSFDYGEAHFTILDNSRSDILPPEETAYLKSDLEAHPKQPIKFVISHRPSWLIPAALGNRDFELHRLAKQYGVRYVIAGHVHQLLHIDLDGILYLSVESAGGHLRASEKYEDGWFFGQTLAEVRGKEVHFQIHELKAPHGQGRTTTPEDWGMLGLKR